MGINDDYAWWEEKREVAIQWAGQWARKLYPHWEWLCAAPDWEAYFLSDSVLIKARQCRFLHGRLQDKRGIIMQIGFEDLLRLWRLPVYERVEILKKNLHWMLQNASVVEPSKIYPTYYWRGKNELEFLDENL